MRVCRVVDHFPAGGRVGGDLEPNYYYFSRHAASRGHEVHVLCGRRPGEPEEEEVESIRVHRIAPLQNRRGYLWGEFARALVARARALRPDIVHGHTSHHFALALRKERVGAPVVTHIHTALDGFLFMDYPPLRSRGSLRYRAMIASLFPEYLAVLARSDAIVAISEFCAQRIRRHLPRAPVHVVHNGVDGALFRPGPSRLPERFPGEDLVLFSGRAVPWKGLHYLLRAVAHLSRERPVRLLLLGSERPDTAPFCDWLRRQASRWGYSRLTFLPPVGYSATADYYRGASVFALPSYPEAQSKALCEALACGTPVVATAGGGIPEMLEGTRNLLFRPKDWRDLREKLDRALDGGYGTVKLYSWERAGDQVLDVYERVVDSARS